MGRRAWIEGDCHILRGADRRPAWARAALLAAHDDFHVLVERHQEAQKPGDGNVVEVAAENLRARYGDFFIAVRK